MIFKLFRIDIIDEIIVSNDQWWPKFQLHRYSSRLFERIDELRIIIVNVVRSLSMIFYYAESTGPWWSLMILKFGCIIRSGVN